VTISELGSLGEFVSAVAVLVTLIYLSVQVRQAKLQAATAQAQLRQDSGRAMLMHLTQPALGSLIAEVNAQTGHTMDWQVSLERELGLNSDQAHRLAWWCFVQMRYFETYLSLGDPPNERFRHNLKINFQQPFVRVWWQDGKSHFKPETVALMDDIVREIEEETRKRSVVEAR